MVLQKTSYSPHSQYHSERTFYISVIILLWKLCTIVNQQPSHTRRISKQFLESLRTSINRINWRIFTHIILWLIKQQPKSWKQMTKEDICLQIQPFTALMNNLVSALRKCRETNFSKNRHIHIPSAKFVWVLFLLRRWRLCSITNRQVR